MGGRTSKRPQLDVEEKEERKKRTAGGQEKQKPVRGKEGRWGIPGWKEGRISEAARGQEGLEA
jgi:hypothetical protein